ncbi:MAG: hypothetical protein WC410_01605 [Candidatus Paceibacterota bacterium]|jgi:hypothetical protein
MNKKLKMFLAVFLVIVLASFLIFKVVEYKNEKADELNYLNIEDFTKTEVDGKTVLENEDIGLRFTVPQGWETGYSYWSNVSMRSLDFEPLVDDPSGTPFPQKGCFMDVMLSVNSKNGFSYDFVHDLANIEGYAESNSTETSKYEKVEINTLRAVKYTHILTSNKGSSVSIQIPYNKTNKVFAFYVYLTGQDKEKCLEEFNSFINSVYIK